MLHVVHKNPINDLPVVRCFLFSKFLPIIVKLWKSMLGANYIIEHNHAAQECYVDAKPKARGV